MLCCRECSGSGTHFSVGLHKQANNYLYRPEAGVSDTLLASLSLFGRAFMRQCELCRQRWRLHSGSSAQ